MSQFTPNELYDSKTLYTLSGASMGVRIFSNVISMIYAT